MTGTGLSTTAADTVDPGVVVLDLTVPDLTGTLAVVTGTSDGLGLGPAWPRGWPGPARRWCCRSELAVNRSARDAEDAARLWTVSQRLVGVAF